MTAEERSVRIVWSLIDQPAVSGNSAVAEIHDRDRAERIIVDAITAAVLAERERCAKIAETWGGAPPNPNGRRAALAAAIRGGDQS